MNTLKANLHWSAGLHHDSSALYVSNPLPKYNERVMITLRAPANAPIHKALLRTAPDGENHHAPMTKIREDQVSAWWQAEMPATMPRNPYRFKIYSDEGIFHLNAAGVSRFERPDALDFKLLTDYAAPSWLGNAVFYQIFPDRFAQGDPSLAVKPDEWHYGPFKTQFRPWGAPLLPWREAGNLDFYGGDFPGIIQRLDYLADLGVNAIYLTPIFLSYSNHRYDIADFYNVDPHLGGNDGLAALRRALDERGMHLALDITLNHCGSRNRWFTAAQADLASPTAEYFTFYDHNPDNYEAWLGVRTLPKLNYRSQALRDVLYQSHDAVLRHWLREPYRIDAWRLDVANMQGRQGAIQLGNKIGRQIRSAVKHEAPNTYIFGEHFYDGTPDLQGDELDASMNYQGFTLPLWRWLCGRELGYERQKHQGAEIEIMFMAAEDMATQWQIFRAAIPWQIATQQFNLLDSHDTVRLLDKVGHDKALVKLAATLLLTYPGVPCIYYGDEIGLPGGDDPDNRRCMPWEDKDKVGHDLVWDNHLHAFFKQGIAWRKSAPALLHGGYQDLYAHNGLIAYQRQSVEQRLIVIAHRGPDTLNEAAIPVWQGGIHDGAVLVDWVNGGTHTVTDGTIHLSQLERGAVLLLEEKR
jgi:alpha-glucosidase